MSIINSKQKDRLFRENIELRRKIAKCEKIEKELKLFSHSIENSVDGVAMGSLNGKITYVNKAFIKMFGYRKKELIGKEIAFIYAKDQIQKLKKALKTTMEGGWIGELVAKRKDGTLFPIMISSSRVADVNGNIIAQMAVHRDITEGKKADEEIKNYQKKIDLLINSSTDIIFLKDEKFRYLIANKRHEKLFDIKVKDIINKTDFDFMSKIVAKHCRKSDIETLKSGFVSREEFLGEKCFHVVKQRVVNTEGKIIGIAGVIRDITKRKKIEEEIVYRNQHDELTGLYNRSFFEKEMKRLNTKRQLPISIVIGDVNGLKLVNDGFGHSQGDKLLQNIAQALKKACRKKDIISRWGGDEFVVLLPKTSEKTAKRLCSRIQDVCFKSVQYPISASITLGIASRMKPKQNLREVLAKAEDIMYTNKIFNEKKIRSVIFSSLQKTLAKKSYESREHAQRLRRLAVRMGYCLGLSNSEMDLLELLAVLHDIGKVAISTDILTKSEPLTPKEWEEIKKHSKIGYRVIKSLPELMPVAEAVLAHHEWWNGKGYPYGLKGEEIPLISRIIAIVDAYDVMVYSKRPYKKRISSQEALKEIEKQAGSQFDPDLTRLFIKIIDKLGEKAIS